MVGLLKQKESPRREYGGNPRNHSSDGHVDLILADAVDSWEAEAARLRLLKDGRAVFIVAAIYCPSGARRNKVFMTATGAQRHATALIERGHRASVELAALTPTATLLGGDGRD